MTIYLKYADALSYKHPFYVPNPVPRFYQRCQMVSFRSLLKL